VSGPDLGLVVEANRLSGDLEGRSERDVDLRQGSLHLVGIDHEGPGAGSVETFPEFEDRLVAADTHVVDDGPDGGERPGLVEEGAWEHVDEVPLVATQVCSSEHPATLAVAPPPLGGVCATRPSDQVADGLVLDQTLYVAPEYSPPSGKGAPSDAELSSVVGQLDALLDRIGELLDGGPDGERTDDTAGLLEVERHLRGARRELGRTRRRLG
jgi:hypothetical protein